MICESLPTENCSYGRVSVRKRYQKEYSMGRHELPWRRKGWVRRKKGDHLNHYAYNFWREIHLCWYRYIMSWLVCVWVYNNNRQWSSTTLSSFTGMCLLAWCSRAGATHNTRSMMKLTYCSRNRATCHVTEIFQLLHNCTKNRLKRLAIDKWPWRLLKVIGNCAISWATVTCY